LSLVPGTVSFRDLPSGSAVFSYTHPNKDRVSFAPAGTGFTLFGRILPQYHFLLGLSSSFPVAMFFFYFITLPSFRCRFLFFSRDPSPLVTIGSYLTPPVFFWLNITLFFFFFSDLDPSTPVFMHHLDLMRLPSFLNKSQPSFFRFRRAVNWPGVILFCFTNGFFPGYLLYFIS